MLDLFYYKRNAMTKNIQREPNKYFQIKIHFFSTNDGDVKILLFYKFNRYSSLFVLYFLVLLDFCLS